jgi:UDP-4-amino-4,6-dideoxy-N-acetyl-beta-L-altrosamine transaminase
MIPYGRQEVTEADIDAVTAVLRSDFLTQGPMVPRFEQTVAGHVGATHALAVNSATSALHIACLALDLGPGDWLWTSPTTFVASANCALYCGADVDFVDIDPVSFNLCPVKLAQKLESSAKLGTLPKVIIPVHMAGQPCDMAEIARLARQYGVAVIEDASHAIGSSYRGFTTGSCEFSDITVFSFHPVKIITTAEGGMATTRSAELARRMRLLRSHGITREAAELQRADEGPWYYEQLTLGFNYRMTDIQAALGLSQMAHLDEWIDQRHRLADRYDSALADLPLILPRRHTDMRQALHLYIIQVDGNKTQISRRALFEALRAENIGVNVHYIPVHMHPYYQSLGFHVGDFPLSEAYYARCISLPMYAGLSTADQDRVIDVLRKVLS